MEHVFHPSYGTLRPLNERRNWEGGAEFEYEATSAFTRERCTFWSEKAAKFWLTAVAIVASGH